MGTFWIKHPWSGSLLWSTVLSALVFAGSMVWHAGFPQWAFLLFFGALWVFLTLCLANDRFNEQSGLILARVLDENVDHLLDRIGQLERTLAGMNQAPPEKSAA
ncbi:MAG: hypothetical protein ACREO9_05015 [Lysobacterales bacterium]